MEKNILDASANELVALAISIVGYIGNSYNTEDLAILSCLFNTIGDGISIYAAVGAKQSNNTNTTSDEDINNVKKRNNSKDKKTK